MRFLGRSAGHEGRGYVVRPPYAEARAELLSRRPAPSDPFAARPLGTLFAAVVDVALEHYLVSVYLFGDGTISIYSTGGIHSTGLRGAQKVADAAAAILEDVERAVDEFSPVDDLGELPLPEPGQSQILARTSAGDFLGSYRVHTKREVVDQLAAMALLLTQLARAAVIEGLDRVEPGELRYRLAPEYRRIRATLMDWLPPPEEIPAGTRVASVAVEIGSAETEVVTSLFAFADGKTSVYRSDGTVVEGLTARPNAVAATEALLASVEASLSAFRPAALITLPQPGRVQFVVRARSDEAADWVELTAAAEQQELAGGAHPLAAAFGRANEVLELAR